MSSHDDAHSTATLPQPDPKPGMRWMLRAGDLVEIGGFLFQEAESLLNEGRRRRLRIRLGRKTIAEMPLTTGAVGVLASLMLAVALTRLTVEVE